ncbi:hypothetical protein QM565_17870, partial [Geitlerinema splendidum]|nr:hypothetical protein [Geitlerinema splendidum]
GVWELGVGVKRMGGWGEEKIGRLDDYQLSTFFSLGTPLLGVQATELRTNSALSSDSELGTLHSFPHSAHCYAEASYSTLHSALGEAL